MRDPASFIMSEGPYIGLTLGEIADEDPLYLDSLMDAEIEDLELADAIGAMNQRMAARIDSMLEDDILEDGDEHDPDPDPDNDSFDTDTQAPDRVF